VQTPPHAPCIALHLDNNSCVQPCLTHSCPFTFLGFNVLLCFHHGQFDTITRRSNCRSTTLLDTYHLLRASSGFCSVLARTPLGVSLNHTGTFNNVFFVSTLLSQFGKPPGVVPNPFTTRCHGCCAAKKRYQLTLHAASAAMPLLPPHRTSISGLSKLMGASSRPLTWYII